MYMWQSELVLSVFTICSLMMHSVVADDNIIQTVMTENQESQLDNATRNLVSIGDLDVEKHKEAKTPNENACVFYCAEQDANCIAVEYERYTYHISVNSCITTTTCVCACVCFHVSICACVFASILCV